MVELSHDAATTKAWLYEASLCESLVNILRCGAVVTSADLDFTILFPTPTRFYLKVGFTWNDPGTEFSSVMP